MLSGETAEFRRRLVAALSRFTPSDWDRLERELRFILGGESDSETASPPEASSPSLDGMTRAELHAEPDRQLDEQEKNARDA